MRTTITRSRRWKALAGGALIVASGLTWAPTAHAAQTINSITPVSGIVTNGCPGSEPVQLSGYAHRVIVFSDSGDIQHYSLNFQGVQAVGLETGTTYRVNSNVEFTSPPSGTVTSSHFHGVTVGPGPDNNDLFRAEFHITVNQDGTVTASFSGFFENCTQ